MMKLTNRATIIICIAVVIVIAAVFFFVNRGDDSDSTDASNSSSADSGGVPFENNFYGNATQAPTYAVEPGTGDNGGDVKEELPELSVPQNQPASYYHQRLCDMAQMYSTLNNADNREAVEQWFGDAVPLIEPYTDNDDDLISLLDAIRDADDKPAAAEEKCAAQ